MPTRERKKRNKEGSIKSEIPCRWKWSRISFRTLRLSFSNPSAAESSPICSTVAHEEEEEEEAEEEEEGLCRPVPGSRGSVSRSATGSSGSMDLRPRKKRHEPVRMEPTRRAACKEMRFLRYPTCLIPVTDRDLSVPDRTFLSRVSGFFFFSLRVGRADSWCLTASD